MITAAQVKAVAEPHLNAAYRYYSAKLGVIFEPGVFNQWCNRCATRCDQLNMAGNFKTGGSIVLYIEESARAYAEVQLRKIGVNAMAVLNNETFNGGGSDGTIA